MPHAHFTFFNTVVKKPVWSFQSLQGSWWKFTYWSRNVFQACSLAISKRWSLVPACRWYPDGPACSWYPDARRDSWSLLSNYCCSSSFPVLHWIMGNSYNYLQAHTEIQASSDLCSSLHLPICCYYPICYSSSLPTSLHWKHPGGGTVLWVSEKHFTTLWVLPLANNFSKPLWCENWA